MHDTEQIEKDWFIELSPVYKTLLSWIEKKHQTSGIYDVNIGKFIREYWHGEITKSDIDLSEFADQCNADGKKRILLFNDGRKLLYATTIAFQEKGNLVNNFAHRGIIQQLAKYPETRAWLTDQVKWEKVKIDSKLLSYLIEAKDKKGEYSNAKDIREFALSLAQIINANTQNTLESENDQIKKRDGLECQYCSKKGSLSTLEVDHIIPGLEHPKNKVTACKTCNGTKDNSDVFNFLLINNKAGKTPKPRIWSYLDSLQSEGFLHYPSNYPLGIGIGIGNSKEVEDTSSLDSLKKKKTKKEKPVKSEFTYQQVMKIHSNPRDTRTMKDFKPISPGEKGTKWKKRSEAY